MVDPVKARNIEDRIIVLAQQGMVSTVGWIAYSD